MPNFIKHIAFKVEDVEKERAFYENVFGYKHVNTVRRKGVNGDHISHHLSDGYMDLTLIHYESSNSDEADFAGPAPCIHHIGMEVEDLEAFIEQIKANGGQILTEPGHLPVKFRSPSGPVAEVVPMKRWEKDTLAAGVHGEVLE
ncbi:VOC family protein [Paraburkholderia guartelaensis]|uniref:VOC family protein n=1 Tax=Paraburkholderia guartelaensis TaxID=2546446 RepID=UPI002AB79222|nr:VOC family protein [Paraburkholderia guartelaensis]